MSDDPGGDAGRGGRRPRKDKAIFMGRPFSELPYEMRHMIKNARRNAQGYGRVRCDGCGDELDYEYGSIRWGCSEDDLCPSCAATQAVKRMFAAGRAALADEKE